MPASALNEIKEGRFDKRVLLDDKWDVAKLHLLLLELLIMLGYATEMSKLSIDFFNQFCSASALWFTCFFSSAIIFLIYVSS